MLKAEIEKSLPGIVATASSNSRSRIKAIYDNLLTEAKKHELRWLNSQEESINEVKNARDEECEKKISMLREVHDKLISC